MANKLVLCLDGTSNQYRKDNTNVLKLYSLLDKRATEQITYYQPGVGTRMPVGIYSRSRAWLLTRLDLAFATLLKHQVQDAYRFLMRHYQAGDEIYLFGFSRGAYTARVLAGMLHKVGLLTAGNEELIPFAWDAYAPLDNFPHAAGFRATFGRKVRVRFLGVWDTVSSVRWAGKPVALPSTQRNPSVDKFRHAVALDERRAYFRQNLWKTRPRGVQDAKEVWFAGVHCDVGGGYAEAECGLSKITLSWMIRELDGALRLDEDAVAQMLPAQDTKKRAAANPLAPIHESLRGVWKLVEWIPKRYRDKQNKFAWRWMLPGGRRRVPPDDAWIHPSVIARMRAANPRYSPTLPSAYRIESEGQPSP